MSKLSQAKKIVKLLQDNSNERFSARDIAEKIVSIYPQDYEEKKSNPRFKDEKSFISQIIAEIGSQKDQLTKSSEHIFWQDKPRPRVYWYDPDKKRGDIPHVDIENENEDSDEDMSPSFIQIKSSFQNIIYIHS